MTAELVALRQAFQPVYASLKLSPRTKSFISQIERIKHSTRAQPLTIPGGCSARGNNGATMAMNDPGVLNGVYRVEWSEKELVAVGASRLYVDSNFGFLGGHAGVVTLRMQAGRFTIEAIGAPWSPCTGTYTVTRTSVVLAFRPPKCEGRVIAKWSLRHDRLRLRAVHASDPGDAVTFGAKLWVRIS